MAIDNIFIDYSNIIDSNLYTLNKKTNSIYINPAENEYESVSKAYFELLGLNDYDKFTKDYKQDINELLIKLRNNI